ncbi:hypothetical protein RMQ97_04105 [Maricaulis sp. D1M11]|uniref:hypothetical protein n=1 Tax=Maricaulis sp. D1M11 TaxID=3076117 RepID=UPI0039B3D0F9
MLDVLFGQFHLMHSPIDNDEVTANFVSIESGEILYWFEGSEKARYDDLLLRFEECDVEGVRYCRDGDFPIIIPNNSHEREFSIENGTYTVQISNSNNTDDICDSYKFDLLVESETRRMHYKFNVFRGLYSIEGHFYYNGEWEVGLDYGLVVGAAIEYADFC